MIRTAHVYAHQWQGEFPLELKYDTVLPGSWIVYDSGNQGITIRTDEQFKDFYDEYEDRPIPD